MKKKTLLSWTSGKDSAWALHLLQQNPSIELLGLFTVMNQKYNRVSMHATRLESLSDRRTLWGCLFRRSICLIHAQTNSMTRS
jgi:diphthamide synthase (EF-2-diphthine--ammonia ligase)